MKDLLRTADLTRADLDLLLGLARRFKQEPTQRRTELSNQTVVLYFTKPSTRTRLSMATAVARLGGVPITVGPQELQLGRGESIEDTARTISRYARAVVIRTYDQHDVVRFAAAASIPVINALTDRHHPCQSLADLLTLEQHVGPMAGIEVAYVGAGNNVCHSLMEAVALAGGHLRVATPASMAPDADVVDTVGHLAQAHGATITLGHDPAAAVREAHAVYTDVWSSMGDPEDAQQARHRALRPFQVNAALMGLARPDARFLHCLPDHPGQEVTQDVLDSPASVIYDQAENRLHTAVALLYALLEGRLVGRAA